MKRVLCVIETNMNEIRVRENSNFFAAAPHYHYFFHQTACRVCTEPVLLVAVFVLHC